MAEYPSASHTIHSNVDVDVVIEVGGENACRTNPSSLCGAALAPKAVLKPAVKVGVMVNTAKAELLNPRIPAAAAICKR